MPEFFSSYFLLVVTIWSMPHFMTQASSFWDWLFVMTTVPKRNKYCVRSPNYAVHVSLA